MHAAGTPVMMRASARRDCAPAGCRFGPPAIGSVLHIGDADIALVQPIRGTHAHSLVE